MKVQTLGTIFAIVVGCMAFFSTAYSNWKQITYQRLKDELAYKSKIYDEDVKRMTTSFDSLYSKGAGVLSGYKSTLEISDFYGSLAIALQYIPSEKKESFYKLRTEYVSFLDGHGNSEKIMDTLYECIDISNGEIYKIQEEQKQLLNKPHETRTFLWMHF